MNADSYYDPPSWTEWSADFYCNRCDEDTPHDFYRQSSVTFAKCGTCDHERELDPDYFE